MTLSWNTLGCLVQYTVPNSWYMYTGDGCPHCPQMEASASTPQRCIVKLWWTRQTLLWNNWVMSDCADNFGFHTHTRAHTHTDASNNHSTHREKLVSGKNANISYVSSYKFSTQWVQIPSKSQDTLLDTLYKHFSALGCLSEKLIHRFCLTQSWHKKHSYFTFWILVLEHSSNIFFIITIYATLQ